MSFIEHIDVDSKNVAEEMKTKKEKSLLSLSMGSDLHEAWRAGRKKEDGTFEPRIKKTKDQSYINAHGGNNEVDIANLSFAELPSDWQYENLEAAKVAIEQVYAPVKEGKEITSEMIEKMSETVHVEWLKRNDWVFNPDYGDPNLAKPYAELVESEKAKDRIQILQAIEKTRSFQRGEINLESLEAQFGEQLDRE